MSRASGDARNIAFKSGDLNERHFSFFIFHFSLFTLHSSLFTFHLTTFLFFPFVDLITDLGSFFIIFFADDFVEHGGEII